MPKVSIIAPLTNDVLDLKKMIHSVLNQNFQEFELLLVTNFHNKNNFNDPRIKYLNVPPLISNIYDFIYAGIENSSTDLICFLSSNDLLLYDALYLRYDEFVKNPQLVACYGFGLDTDLNYDIKNNDKQGYFYSQNTELPVNNIHSVLAGKINLTLSSIMLRKEVFEKVKFTKNLNIFYSWKFFMDLFSEYPQKILQIKDPIYISCNDEAGIIKNKKKYILNYLKESIYSLDCFFKESKFHERDKSKYIYYRNIFYNMYFIILEYFSGNYFLNVILIFNYIKKNQELNNKLIEPLFLHIIFNSIFTHRINKAFGNNNYLSKEKAKTKYEF